MFGECPGCGDQLRWLCQQGNRAWFKCDGCGEEVSRLVRT